MDWCNTLYLNYVNNVSFNFANCSVLLFAPYICNCVARFVSSHRKAFKIKMVVQAPRSATLQFSSVQFSSIQLLSRVRLCNPMNPSSPGLPVHHQPPEFTQTHPHRVNAIQPSPPLSSPSPPAPNPSQHQGLFQ